MELSCEYVNFELAATGEIIYIARVIGINLIASVGRIFRIYGTHLEGKSNTDVHTFIINDFQIETFPRNLCNFYPNLKSISVISCGLQTLSKLDLHGCEGIEKLMLNGNKIKQVPAEVFDYAQNLETVSFFKNQIEYVPENVFDGLAKMKSIDFGSNPEIDFSCRQVKRGRNILEVIKEKLWRTFGHKSEQVDLNNRIKFLSFGKALDYLLYFQDSETIAVENRNKIEILFIKYQNMIA